jgi:hypothetical protein
VVFFTECTLSSRRRSVKWLLTTGVIFLIEVSGWKVSFFVILLNDLRLVESPMGVLTGTLFIPSSFSTLKNTTEHHVLITSQIAYLINDVENPPRRYPVNDGVLTSVSLKA